RLPLRGDRVGNIVCWAEARGLVPVPRRGANLWAGSRVRLALVRSLALAQRLLATCRRSVSVGFGLAAGEEAEFGAGGGAREAEGFGGAGLEAADGAHDVGEDEGVETLDEMAIELGLVRFHAFVECARERVPVG